MNQEQLDRQMQDFLPFNVGIDKWIISEAYLVGENPTYKIIKVNFSKKGQRITVWQGTSLKEMENQWEKYTGEAR